MHAIQINNSDFESFQNPRLLVFPLDLDQAQEFIVSAKAMNCFVVGASSVMENADNLQIDEFAYLPYVTDHDFDEHLKHLLSQYNITHIHTAHSAVWNHIDNFLKTNPDFNFHLCKPDPFETNWKQFEKSFDWVEKVLNDKLVERIETKNDTRALLPSINYAGLHKQFKTIPGQCDDEKLLSLTAIMRLIPSGDVVEIGSLYGRSAYALAFLAFKYSIGTVLSVDPWKFGKIKPQGDTAKLLNKQIGVNDPENIFQVFLAIAVLVPNLGYIRDTSENAVETYKKACKQNSLYSEFVGEHTITGEIALLHIDGNHKYEEVMKDVKYWVPMVKSGGWVLLDDYVWAFGDGPQRVGDELLQKNMFDIMFCLGDTLFLRKK